MILAMCLKISVRRWLVTDRFHTFISQGDHSYWRICYRLGWYYPARYHQQPYVQPGTQKMILNREIIMATTAFGKMNCRMTSFGLDGKQEAQKVGQDQVCGPARNWYQLNRTTLECGAEKAVLDLEAPLAIRLLMFIVTSDKPFCWRRKPITTIIGLSRFGPNKRQQSIVLWLLTAKAVGSTIHDSAALTLERLLTLP